MAQTSDTLSPVADAYVRDGSFATTNFGSDTTLNVKGSLSVGYTRLSYLKFSLSNVSNIGTARLRVFGKNAENATSIAISSFGVNDDSWTESGINFNNAPAASVALTSTGVTDQEQYYEFDVTDYAKAQLAGDKMITLLLKDTSNQGRRVFFRSKEDSANPPQLIISPYIPSNASLFIENMDHFPSNDLFISSRVEIPWTRDTVTYNANHDSTVIRIHNNGINSLIIKSLTLSDSTSWVFDKLKGVDYVAGTSLPLTINPGSFADLTVKFVAVDSSIRVKIYHDTLTIVSNDDNFPAKTVYFNGLLQAQGEGQNEPHLQEIINAFGFKTSTGFDHTDPDEGDSTKLEGDQILSSFFVAADTSRPIIVRQMSAYHTCCTNTEKIMWYPQGTSTLNTIVTHRGDDAQTLLPKKNSSTSPALASFNPTTSFGFQVGFTDNSDPSKNPGGKIGLRILKAYDRNGNIIPNSFILSNDYLGTESTNYDYNDNTYFVSNIKPAEGPAFSSELKPTPSDIDFGEKVLQTHSSFNLKLSNLGKTYSDTVSDPAIHISSFKLTGENSSEFSASMPVKDTLNAGDSTTITVNFNPVSQGLKIADLYIYYNNSLSPLRVPLYGTARAADTTVVVNYRINSGSSTPLTINGKTWAADTQYAFDNIEPYTNPSLHQIACTDEDSLYLKEQSSDSTKRPFRYEFPVENGDYVVRLHFAEIYWGAPGLGLYGGAGSRIMNISLENQLRLVNFDVTQQAGGGATALVKNLPVTVTDGKLNIDFNALVNRPMVVAVEVISFRGSTILSSADPLLNILPAGNGLKKPKVFPNPLQKEFTIEFPNSYSGYSTLQIADALGRIYTVGKVKLQRGISNNTTVDISNLQLQAGVYYLRILSETRPTDIIKLVIQ